MPASVSPRPEQASPFLKWAGGKGQLLPQFARFYPDSVKRYFELFIGSGAVFFDAKRRFSPRYVLLSDTNAELINCYQVVRDDVEGLIALLARHRGRHRLDASRHYYRVRDLSTDELTPQERAARLIYLNKTCFNGLYRVNSQGQFNVPLGRYENPAIVDAPSLRAASAALQRARIHVLDFEQSLSKTRSGDFVYVDPPYFPLSPTSNFTGYTEGGFGFADQERLARFARALDKRGCLLMLSNSNTTAVRRLYQGFHIHRVSARRAINSNGGRRGLITELVVTNYEPRRRG